MHKILIVDDEEDIVDMLDMYFSSQGYLPIKAYNYKDVVKGLNQSPSAILLDIMMPEIDGYEICEKIRDSVNCPIIFLTAKSNSEDIIKGQIFSKDQIYEKIWGYDDGEIRTISEHIKNIRKKIAELDDENYITTVWGIGYKWE